MAIENTMVNAEGETVSLKPGAEVDVVIEAAVEDTIEKSDPPLAVRSAKSSRRIPQNGRTYPLVTKLARHELNGSSRNRAYDQRDALHLGTPLQPSPGNR
jgi:hypothetical protein